MARLLWLAAGLVLLAAGLYLAGRAPSRYVLERECAAYHEERRARYGFLSFEIGRREHRGEDARDLKREREELLLATKRFEIRGWEIVLVPAGARRPDPTGFAVSARVDPSEFRDPAPLKGTMEAWTAPRGWLARLFAR